MGLKLSENVHNGLKKALITKKDSNFGTHYRFFPILSNASFLSENWFCGLKVQTTNMIAVLEDSVDYLVFDFSLDSSAASNFVVVSARKSYSFAR